MQFSSCLKYGFRVTRKAKIYKRPILSGIPHYHKPNPVDIHDRYQYRTKDEVMKEVSQSQYEITVTIQSYSEMDDRADVKSRKAMIQFNVDQFKFTEWQYERFKVLMGTRYSEDKRQAKMVCEYFPTYLQNYEKLMQQLKEVILEAKRAP